jgi:hypothetical protein
LEITCCDSVVNFVLCVSNKQGICKQVRRWKCIVH